MVNGYLSHGVRLSLVIMLVNSQTGLKACDIEFLERLEYYNKPVQIVLSKIDKIKGRGDLTQSLEKTGMEI